MSKGAITVNYQARLSAFDLPVRDSLVGATLSFESSGKTVSIQLPGDRKRRDYMTRCEFVVSAAGEESATTWTAHWVDISVKDGAEVWLTDLDDLLSPADTDTERARKFRASARLPLSKAGVVAENFVKSAFDRFARALRAVKMDGTIARIPEETQMGGTRLVNAQNEHEVYSTGRSSDVFDLRPSRWLTPADWQAAEQLLRGGGSPIYLDLLFDAEQHFEERDLNRAVLDLAMANEVFMKLRIRQTLPAGVSLAAQDVISRANIPNQMKMFQDSLGSVDAATYKDLKGQIQAISEARNSIVHSGTSNILSDQQVYDWLKITRRFLMLGHANFEEFFPKSARFTEGGYLDF